MASGVACSTARGPGHCDPGAASIPLCLQFGAVTRISRLYTPKGARYDWRSSHHVRPTTFGAVVRGIHEHLVRREVSFERSQRRWSSNRRRTARGNRVAKCEACSTRRRFSRSSTPIGGRGARGRTSTRDEVAERDAYSTTKGPTRLPPLHVGRGARGWVPRRGANGATKGCEGSSPTQE